MHNRIALGTVQFGLSYGVANRTGQVQFQQARDIVAACRKHGIDTLDTAIAYGTSEQVLGEIGVGGFTVISKLPAVPEETGDVMSWVIEQVQASLQRMRLPRLRALLLHRPDQLLGERGREIYAALQELKARGLLMQAGVSIYEPDVLDSISESMPFDLVQAPLNLLDRRLVHSGWVRRLHAAGTEIHVRSIFLQGLLLLPAHMRNPYFDRWRDLWARYDSWLDHSGLSPLQACVQHALSLPEISRVVVGVDSLAQLDEIVAAARREQVEIPEALFSNDADLLNPGRWRLE